MPSSHSHCQIIFHIAEIAEYYISHATITSDIARYAYAAAAFAPRLIALLAFIDYGSDAFQPQIASADSQIFSHITAWPLYASH
jgi:hypothetical protein